MLRGNVILWGTEHETSHKDALTPRITGVDLDLAPHRNFHKFHFVQSPSIKGKGAFIIVCTASYRLFLPGKYFHFDEALMKTEYAGYNYTFDAWNNCTQSSF